MIEVFVHSFSPIMDVETCRDMIQHPFCAPSTTEGLVSDLLSKFKGKLFSEEDSTTLSRAIRIMEKTDDPLKIRGVSTVVDRLRAMKCGIKNTPAVIVDGKKYETYQEILKVFSAFEETGEAP